MYEHGSRCAPGALELTAIGARKCRTGPKYLLACNRDDVSPSGADGPNGALLSGLDADSSVWVTRTGHPSPEQSRADSNGAVVPGYGTPVYVHRYMYYSYSSMCIGVTYDWLWPVVHKNGPSSLRA